MDAGQIAFTDAVVRAPLMPDETMRLGTEMHAPGIATSNQYIELLRARGCVIEHHEDLSAEWSEVLVKRLAMYRALRDTTVAKFGESHFAAWDHTYSFFVGLFTAGKLGGARIAARKAAA